MEEKRKQQYKMIGLNIAYYRKLKGMQVQVDIEGDDDEEALSKIQSFFEKTVNKYLP